MDKMEKMERDLKKKYFKKILFIKKSFFNSLSKIPAIKIYKDKNLLWKKRGKLI